MAQTLPIGGTVIVPWNTREALATVMAVNGNYPRTEVVAELSPELSGPGIDRRVTLTVSFRDVRRVRRPIGGSESAVIHQSTPGASASVAGPTDRLVG